MKNNFNIPITYAGGTGGNFLSSWLNAASLNDQSVLNYSEYGNAHKTNINILYGGGMNISTGTNLTKHLSEEEKILLINDEVKNYHLRFFATHMANKNLLLNYFEKIIIITYKKSNIEEVSIVHTVKWAKDDDSPSVKKWVEEKLKTNTYPEMYSSFMKYQKVSLLRFLTDFTEEVNENIIYVSWNNLYNEDYHVLVNKLSNQLDIPKENFNLENLFKWRELTLKGIKKFPELVI
jgi:hypothetical protein